MLGGAEEWFYRGLGGIDFDISRPEAAERITIRPRIIDGVTWVKCSYDSKLGMVKSAWRRGGVVTTFDVALPAQSTIVLPLRTAGASVTEDGHDATARPGIAQVRRDKTEIVLRVEQGSYHFIVTESGS
jgi:alpha-L-rhamnosidase